MLSPRWSVPVYTTNGTAAVIRDESDMWIGQLEECGAGVSQARCNRSFTAAEIQKYMYNTGSLNPLFRSLQRRFPVAQSYAVCRNNAMRMYPSREAFGMGWVDQVFANYLDFSTFEFWYLADPQHDPSRGIAWTSSYLDAAGLGWMTTVVSPVDTPDGGFDCIAGIDITIEQILGFIAKVDAPFGGYLMIVESSGIIMALPPAGSRDFGLQELTTSNYSSFITTQNFKPDSFNVHKREDTRELSAALNGSSDGVSTTRLGKVAKSVSWREVTEEGCPKWTVLVIAGEREAYADSREQRSFVIGIAVGFVVVLVAVSALFLVVVVVQSRAISATIKSMVNVLGMIFGEIRKKNYATETYDFSAPAPGSHGRGLVGMFAHKIRSTFSSSAIRDFDDDKKAQLHRSPSVAIQEIYGVIGNAKTLARQLGDSRSLLEKTNQVQSLYVPREMVRWLNLRSILDVTPGFTVSSTLSVAFVDIRSFTLLSERMATTEAMELVNRFARFVIPIVSRHGAVIDKFIGDAAMILHDNTADILQVVMEIVQKARESIGVDVGAGLNTGPVTIGAIGAIGTDGDAGRMEITVISDTVNNAARMESMNKFFGSALLVSEEALRSAEEKVGQGVLHTRTIGHIIPLGKTVPTPMIEVMMTETSEFCRAKQRSKDLAERSFTTSALVASCSASPAWRSSAQSTARGRCPMRQPCSTRRSRLPSRRSRRTRCRRSA